MPRILGALPLIFLWGAPLFLGLFYALMPLGNATAWAALFAHPQLWPGLGLSLWIGSAALVLSALLAFWIVAGLHDTPVWRHMSGAAGSLLALPHLAFAIGFGFLIMPSGFIARVAAQLFAWDSPPHWVSTQDPWGLALIAALALKEIPFLVWTIWTVMARGGMAQVFDGQIRSAQSLGHGMGSIWLRILVPQIGASIVWPLAIVWIYGASVVDMAIAIGPTQPPPLALVVWRDLNDADASINGRGAAGALFLSLAMAFTGVCGYLSAYAAFGSFRRWLSRGPSPRRLKVLWPRLALGLIVAVYLATLATLITISISTRWPFPLLAPEALSVKFWGALVTAPSPLIASLMLAISVSISSLVIAILWLESTPARFDRMVVAAAVLAIAAPALLIASGQYAGFLRLGITGTWTGLFLAHLTPAFAYGMIVLKGPYRDFDGRYRSIAHGLNASGLRFWIAIKAPILKPALIGAFSVAFAVAIAQFVTAQLIASGHFTTLPMEAVTLASGGNRPLTAVYALALTLPPALVFLLGAIYGRPRWS